MTRKAETSSGPSGAKGKAAETGGLTSPSPPLWLTYSLAVMLTVVTLLVRLVLDPGVGNLPTLILFLIPILFSAYVGGLGPGLVSTALAALLANYYLLPPTHTFSLAKGLHNVQWIVLILTGTLISVLNETLHRSRRRTETSRRLLSVTLAAIGDGVITTDRQGRITFLNAEAERLTGWTNREAAGRPFAQVFRIVDSQTRAPVEDWAQTVLSRGAVVNLLDHTLLLTRDDREIPIDDSGAPIREADGAVQGVVIVFRDRSEQERIEETLRKSQESMASAQQVAHFGSWEIDWISDTDVNRNPLRWSDECYRVFGYEPGEVEVTRDLFLQAVHPDDREAVRVTVVSSLEQKRPYSIEHRILLPNGEVRHIREYAQVFYDEKTGRPVKMVGAAQDITARVRLEEQFRQAQKMEAIGQLAGGVAHDFNNMLTVIIGYSELMLATLPEDDPHREFIANIRLAGERAASLTRQLLAFSRKQLLEPRVLELNEVVDNIETMLQRLIGEDILLTTALSPSLSRVRVDPGQMEQVVINLAVNARDAMPQGGRLTIETRDVELDEEYCLLHTESRPGRYALLSVTDTGSGITAEVKAQIFEPFFTTKETGKGTGLGLATVFGIVKQSEGHIEVYSEVGIGTCFKIYLPAVEAEEATSPRSEVVPETTGRGWETILLVEDEEAVRGFARLALEAHGYNVLEADNGRKAILVAESHDGPIHLLVTDVVMPEMSGRRLTVYLQAIRADLKVLFMSGYIDDAVVRHGIIDAHQAFLHKPFSPRALMKKVRDVLDGNEGGTGIG